jgi:SAM-dependent methyltransferase
MQTVQTKLSELQVSAFHHTDFVDSQLRDFERLIGKGAWRVTDIGGGCGYFAQRLQRELGCRVRVIDTDLASIQECRNAGLDADCADALNLMIKVEQDVVTFNLVLHHLVGKSERATRELQSRAVATWLAHARVVFVNEYIYESFVGNVSGWLIFQITKNRLLSALGKWASRYISALSANTFGVGVRFRSNREWVRLFEDAGFVVKTCVKGSAEGVSPLWRLLLIRRISRDSFRLEPCQEIGGRDA